MKTGLIVEMLIFIFSCFLLHSQRYFCSSSIFHVVYSLNTIKFTKPLRIHKATVYSKQRNHSLNAFSHFISVSNEFKQLLSVVCFPSNPFFHVYHSSRLIHLSMVSRLTLHIPFAFLFLFICFQKQRNMAF